MLDDTEQSAGAKPIYYRRAATDIPVAAALAEIEANPDVWDRYTERTSWEASPNYGSHDIWLRFRARSEITEPKHFAEPHFPVFYPEWYKLPAVQAIVWGLVGMVKPVQLGTILITKVPPGQQIKTHDDRGGWCAEYFNYKLWIPLQTNPRVICRFPTGGVVMKTGSAWSVNNLVPHSVENYGDTDRITLIVCARVER
jgi:hypothetical protein